MKIWEVLEGFAKGSYIEGQSFVNEIGQEITYDGETIKGPHNVDLNSVWTFVDYKSRWEEIAS